MVSNFDLNRTVLNNQMMGLSTDTKPTTGILPNSLFWELDTNGMYYFDGTQWQSIGGSGGGGGGGSSDFSTAEVTFLNSLGEGDRESYRFTGAVASDDAEGIVASTFGIHRNETTVFKIPLYKGTYYMSSSSIGGVDNSIMPQVSGNIEMDMTNQRFVITGDCSINAAGGPVE